MHNSPCINLHNPKMIGAFLDAEKNLHKCKQYLFYLNLNGKGAFGDFEKKHKGKNSMSSRILLLALFWIFQNWFDQFWQQQNVNSFLHSNPL